jgi:proteic killer suppression protein
VKQDFSGAKAEGVRRPVNGHSAWHATRGALQFGLIHSLRHKGLQQLFDDDDPRGGGVNPEHVAKLKNIVASLDAAPTVDHMNLPSYRLHPLKGAYKGFWARHRAGQLAGDVPLRPRRTRRG